LHAQTKKNCTQILCHSSCDQTCIKRNPALSLFTSFLQELIKKETSIFKRALFLGSKFTILLFLIILAAGVTLVIAAKQSKFRASSMYSKQSNRHVQPSSPNPCSYLRGAGHCKPPKWCMFHIYHPSAHTWYVCFWKKKILFVFFSYFLIIFFFQIMRFVIRWCLNDVKWLCSYHINIFLYRKSTNHIEREVFISSFLRFLIEIASLTSSFTFYQLQNIWVLFYN
jgi:hypothetical protein